MSKRRVLIPGVLVLVAATAILGAVSWRAAGRLAPGQLLRGQTQADVLGVSVAAQDAFIRAVDGPDVTVRATGLQPRITLESKAPREVRLRLNVANAWRRAGKAHAVILRGNGREKERFEGLFEVAVRPGERVEIAIQGPPEEVEEFEFVVAEGGHESLADLEALLHGLAGDPPAFLIYRARLLDDAGPRTLGPLLDIAERSSFPVFIVEAAGRPRDESGRLRDALFGPADFAFEHAGNRFVFSETWLPRAMCDALALPWVCGPRAEQSARRVFAFLPIPRRSPLGGQICESFRMLWRQPETLLCFSDEAALYGAGVSNAAVKVVDGGRLRRRDRACQAWRVRVTLEEGIQAVGAWQVGPGWLGRCPLARGASLWAYAARGSWALRGAGVILGAAWAGLLAWLGWRVGRRVWGNARAQPPAGERRGVGPLLRGAILGILAALLAGRMYFGGLGARHVSASNESNRIEATREMRLTGDFVLPHINGRIYLTKPPLYYWLCAALWPGRGPHEFRWRLPSVLAALACLGVVYVFARRWFGRRVALVSTVILGASPLFFLQAWEAELDMQLCLLTTLSLCLLYTAIEAETRRLPLFVAAFSALAGAAMTKGPVPLVIAFLMVLTYLLVTLGRRRPCWQGLLIGTAVLVALVAPWCLAVVGRLGFPAAWRIFMEESARRVATASRINSAPWHFYLTRLAATFFPWSLWLPAAAMAAWREGRSCRAKPAARAFLCLGAWFVPSFIFFSVCAGKEAQYILPLYPPLAMACGWVAVRWWEGGLTRAERQAFGVGVCLAGLMTLVAGLVAPGFVNREIAGALLSATAAGAVLVVAGAAVWLFWARRSLPGLLVAAALAFVACKELYVGGIVPHLNGRDSVRAFCRRVAERVPAGTPIYMIGRERSAYSLYTGRVVREMLREKGRQAFLAASLREPGYYLTTDKEYAELGEELGRCELASYTGHPSVLIANHKAVAQGRRANPPAETR